MHNLTKVERIKGDHGLFSDYPHRYKLKLEGKSTEKLFGIRPSENGEFTMSTVEVKYLISIFRMISHSMDEDT